MGTYTGHIMTLANSIIGVSILAMPFCFKECGILLSVLMLIVSSIVSRLACHFLMKSAILTKRRTFELLAFHLFGLNGKFMVELGIIGFLMGTCIAFFVVIGDLAPAIFVKLVGLTSSTATIRSTVLISIALFCILPLGLLKNVDSLTGVCAATIGFYFCLVLKIITESLPHMLSGDWINKVELWKPAGVLQCLPIFSMALCCQTQLFEMYDTLPNASLEKMNSVVRNAVNICTAVYIFIGFFGYVAFCSQPFTGNILMSFTPSVVTDVMKIGFVLSLACSFPLVIFPCRASLFSLLKRVQTLHDVSSYHIPENWFKWLTFIIVGISLSIGLLIPSIELVLGLVGSTIGVMICILFPTTCFIRVFTKNTDEKLLAQIMFIIGLVMMVLGTYTNLYAIEYSVSSSTISPVTKENIPNEFRFIKPDEIKNVEVVNKLENTINDRPMMIASKNEQNDKNYLKDNHVKEVEIPVFNDVKIDLPKNNEVVVELPKSNIPVTKNILDNDIRQEPPQPVESEDIPGVKDEIKPQEIVEKAIVNNVVLTEPAIQSNKINNNLASVVKNENDNSNKEIQKHIDDIEILKIGMDQSNGNKKSDIKKFEDIQLKQKSFENIEIKSKPILELEKSQDVLKQNSDDVKKVKTQIKETTTESGRELLNEIKKQVSEAKQVLEKIKEQNKEFDRKQEENKIEKKKTVEQIKKIADIAINSLNTKSDDKKSDKNYLKNGDDLILKLIPQQTIDKLLQKVAVEKINNLVNTVEEVKKENKSNSDLEKNQNQGEQIDKKVSLSLSDILSNTSGNLNFKNKQYSAPIPILKASNVQTNILNKDKKDENILSKEKLSTDLKKNDDNVNNDLVKKDKQVPEKEKPDEDKEKGLEQEKPKDVVDVPKEENKIKLNADEEFKQDIKNMRRDILSDSISNGHQGREKRDVENVIIKEQEIIDNLNQNCEKRENGEQKKSEMVGLRKDDVNKMSDIIKLNEINVEKRTTKLPELKSLSGTIDRELLNLNIATLEQTLEHMIVKRDIKTVVGDLKKSSEYLKK